jgi:transcription initiation factor TFIIIB Brf1 subunit/transcription initiation factor TFIIB
LTEPEDQHQQSDLLEKVHDIGHELELSNEVLDKASELLDEYRDDFKIYGDYIPAATVHIASRLEDEPRTQKMITDYLESRNNLFSSTDDRLDEKIREAVKKLKKKDRIFEQLDPVESKDYLPYILNKLQVEVSKDERVKAEAYCDAVETRPGVARSKAAIAGACLKAAVEENSGNHSITNAQLAEVTGMNRNTFENNLDYLREEDVIPRAESA